MTIRARIRAALRANRHQTPAMIAETILPRLSDAELYEALRAALPYLVRDEIRKVRHDAIGETATDREERAAGWRMREQPDAGSESGPSSEAAKPEPHAVAERSQRLREAGRKGFDASQAARERARALLATPINVNGQWKQLGDCTPDDLRTVARAMRQRAAENERRADGFEGLAGKLDAAGAGTVADYQGELREEFAGA